MEAKWSDKSKNFKPLIFINLILKSASLNSEGRVQYEGMQHFQNEEMLKSMIIFSGKDIISPKTEDDIFTSALNDFASTAKTTSANLKELLIAAINKRLRAYLATKKKHLPGRIIHLHHWITTG